MPGESSCVTPALLPQEAGAEVINLADTNGILLPEEMAGLVTTVREILGTGNSGAPLIGVHCHNDLGLATANTLAAIRAGASHVEVTVGGFGERAGNAALEEIAFLLTAFGKREGLTHGIQLGEIGCTARLFESLTGIHAHPNKPIIGQTAFVPAAGGFSGHSLDPDLRQLLQEKTIGNGPDAAPPEGQAAEAPGPYVLESFNVLTSSHSPPGGVVVIRRDGKTLTQTSHGNGPIDGLFSAVDKALGFSTRMVLYSVSTLATGTEALDEVIVTVERAGGRFHGRYTSTDVIEASLRAYMRACNADRGVGCSRGTGRLSHFREVSLGIRARDPPPALNPLTILKQEATASSGNAPTISIIHRMPISSPMPPRGTMASPARPHEKPMIREDAIAGELPECLCARSISSGLENVRTVPARTTRTTPATEGKSR